MASLLLTDGIKKQSKLTVLFLNLFKIFQAVIMCSDDFFVVIHKYEKDRKMSASTLQLRARASRFHQVDD